MSEEKDSCELAVGYPVVLKYHNTPVMVVASKSSDGWRCLWFDSNTLREGLFPTDLLRVHMESLSDSELEELLEHHDE